MLFQSWKKKERIKERLYSIRSNADMIQVAKYFIISHANSLWYNKQGEPNVYKSHYQKLLTLQQVHSSNCFLNQV